MDGILKKGIVAIKFTVSFISLTMLIILGCFLALIVFLALLFAFVIGQVEEKAALEEVNLSPITAKIGTWKTTPENTVVSVLDLLPAQASKAELVQILDDQGFKLTDKENSKAITESDDFSVKPFDQCARRLIIGVWSCVYEYNVVMNFEDGLLSEASGAYRLWYYD
ncbi:hypothetical protein GCM10009069_12770 [Algimonas arctica]|uniref:Lipoprotein n=1 Tax=Algimonas arctica TaxID=1479486 RepID=A0A8J3CPQ6_9PROT|nr:hypothetical protein [Algimonas arctica]GHA91090.1 hypothetical protein GCM10009069_12770 [Algimonas arctica]